MSDDLISRRALYDKAATLEAQALDYVGKLIERDGEETSVEWRIWSAILTERTAFKHDVYDAPSAQRTGRWIKHEVKLFNGRHTGRYFDECSECGKLTTEWRKVTEYHRWNFCPNCGAKMEVEE